MIVSDGHARLLAKRIQRRVLPRMEIIQSTVESSVKRGVRELSARAGDLLLFSETKGKGRKTAGICISLIPFEGRLVVGMAHIDRRSLKATEVPLLEYLTLSQHAVERLFQRLHTTEISAVAAELRSDIVALMQGAVAGSARVSLDHGVLVIENKTAVTYIGHKK